MSVTVFQPEDQLPRRAVIDHPGDRFIKILGLHQAGAADRVAAVMMKRQGASQAGRRCPEPEIAPAIGAEPDVINQRKA